jgi:hypothetical protein
VWQSLAVLLAHHVLGTPAGAPLVNLPDGPPKLTVRGCRTLQRASQIVDPHEVRHCRVHVTGQPRRDLLEQPAIAVRILEGGVRVVKRDGIAEYTRTSRNTIGLYLDCPARRALLSPASPVGQLG